MPELNKPFVVAIVGPTCSGKTDLSLEIAKSIDSEIVACDSRTIYRYMDIGTAKPSAKEQAQVPHHMLDLVEPNENFTVAQFKTQADEKIAEIGKRGKVPIVCGGTGFYARTLLEGLVMPDVQPNDELRNELSEYADKNGNSALYERLKSLDPKTADKLNVNDRFRIIRALEVCLTTGKAMSSLAGKSNPPYNTIWIGLQPENRDNLRQSIAARLKAQISQGLLAEIESLCKRYGSDGRLSSTVNYKEFLPYLAGKESLDQAQDVAYIANCQLARRQLIWFRSNPKIHWLLYDRMTKQDVAREALALIRGAITTGKACL